jgi:hypothetical protein
MSATRNFSLITRKPDGEAFAGFGRANSDFEDDFFSANLLDCVITDLPPAELLPYMAFLFQASLIVPFLARSQPGADCLGDPGRFAFFRPAS